MSHVTIVNIQGRETAWPLDEIQVSYCQPNQRTYYLRWNYHRNCAKISSAQIYRMLSDLDMQGHISGLVICHDAYEKEWCAVFTEKALVVWLNRAGESVCSKRNFGGSIIVCPTSNCATRGLTISW